MNKIQIINDQTLEKIVKGYEPQNMIRKEILPSIKVATRSGDIKAGGKEHLRIVQDATKATAGTPWISYTITKSNKWNIVDHRLKNLVTMEDAEQLGGMAAAKVSAGKRVKVALEIQAEYQLASSMQDTSIITQYLTGVAAAPGAGQFIHWSDYTNSTPLEQITTGQAKIFTETGREANVAVMSWAVRQKLQYHPDILDKLGYKDNRAGQLTDQELAKVLMVQKIVIGTARYNSAEEGDTPVMTDIWGKNCWLLYVNPNPKPDVWEDSFGYTFYMNNDMIKMDSYKVQDPPDAEWVRGQMDRDDVILDAKAAYAFFSCIA